MRLVYNHKQIKKRWSTWLNGLGAAVSLSGGAAAWYNVIPVWAVCGLAMVIFIASIVASYIRQEKLHGDDE
jgi:hypothetical protein